MDEAVAASDGTAGPVPGGDAITIHGARQHNLAGLDVVIPKGALTVISGVSGSGKSSLAFDTLYAEGQRCYVESLSTYARQFLEQLEKPDVDWIDGIQPAIAIRQRNAIRSSRSTVGTSTEVHDYLRLLWARIGVCTCLGCGREVRPDAPGPAAARCFDELGEGTRALVLFGAHTTSSLAFDELAERLVAQGYLRALHGGEQRGLEEPWPDAPGEDATVEVVADRLVLRGEDRGRLEESIEAALHAGEGECAVVDADAPSRRLRFSDRFACAECGRRYEPPTPQLFSFNSPIGACPGCKGFGEKLEFDERRIVPDPDRTLGAGALKPWASDSFHHERQRMLRFAKKQGIGLDVAWRKLPARQRELLLEKGGDGYTGVIPWLEEMRANPKKEGHRFFTRRYMGRSRCRECRGARLREEARAFLVGGQGIGEVGALPLPRLQAFLDGLDLEGEDAALAGDVLRELCDRVGFLLAIGLGYLSLDRASRTLSGGEMQRIHLSNALGSRLVETLYVLDEPSIGLHPVDTHRLLASLRELADLGNTVVVVEHDPEVLRAADHLLDLGPGAGRHGGRMLYAGPPPGPGEAHGSESLSCQYLAGEREVPLREERRQPGRRRLTLKRARLHNLREVELTVPLGMLVCISGVSGSGKTSLVGGLLQPALAGQLAGGPGQLHAFDALHGAENIEDVVVVDQSPIGRSSRSNPATYIGVFKDVRDMLASTVVARQRGWTAGRFSFNVAGGRCPTCQGMGEVTVEMHFMADVTVPCDECHGRRFEPSTLEVKYRGLDVAEILDLTVDEAIQFFSEQRAMAQRLWLLQKVGLGYLKLGQPASTLSGGESQRIKVARELMGSQKGHTLYLLDEPTTGLHPEDIRKLLRVLDELVDNGHSVLVIEHNLDVLKNADWVVDLGPGGGPEGGEIVVAGPPESVAENPRSITGRYLAPLLGMPVASAREG